MHTGRFLSGRETIPLPATYRATKSGPTLSIYGASKHNLHDVDAHIPQQAFVCLSGVSGSGKSTLLNNVIYRNCWPKRGRSPKTRPNCHQRHRIHLAAWSWSIKAR